MRNRRERSGRQWGWAKPPRGQGWAPQGSWASRRPGELCSRAQQEGGRSAALVVPELGGPEPQEGRWEWVWRSGGGGMHSPPRASAAAHLHMGPLSTFRRVCLSDPNLGGLERLRGLRQGSSTHSYPWAPAFAPLPLQLVTRGDKEPLGRPAVSLNALRVQRGRPCAPRGPEKASPSLAAPHRRPPCTKAGRPASSGGCHAVTQPPADPR